MADTPLAEPAHRPTSNPVRRLALLGGESSGKTTLARALAARLGTAWVPEYGRQRWEELRETLSVDELIRVARTQVAMEEAAAAQLPAGAGWLVCDTSPLTTLQYCLHDHGGAPPELQALARRSYDLQVVCAPDFAFVQDGARRDDAFRRAQHAWTLDRLGAMDARRLIVGGPLAERIDAVLAAIRESGQGGAHDPVGPVDPADGAPGPDGPPDGARPG